MKGEKPPGHDRGLQGSDEDTRPVSTVRPAIDIRHVDTRPARQVVRAIVDHPDGTLHEVGHLPSEGWFCICRRGKRCGLIAAVAELVPALGGG